MELDLAVAAAGRRCDTGRLEEFKISVTPVDQGTKNVDTMSGGGSAKRMPKRSVIGTKVVAPDDDGRLFPGVIVATKTEAAEEHSEDGGGEEAKYSVRFEDGSGGRNRIKEFVEAEIIGPGFSSVTDCKLKRNQTVYVTHSGREFQGVVLQHRPNIDQVIILLNGGSEVKKKLEDVRLLESRKSARLLGQQHGNVAAADFSKLISRRRVNSDTSSDVSSAGPATATSSRKRRGSETLSESSNDDSATTTISNSNGEESEECSAALVLMNLSTTALEIQAHRNSKSSPAGSHEGHVRCLPGGACLVGEPPKRLPQLEVQEPTDLSQTATTSIPKSTSHSSPFNSTTTSSAMFASIMSSGSPLLCTSASPNSSPSFGGLAGNNNNINVDGSMSPSSTSGVSSLGSSWASGSSSTMGSRSNGTPSAHTSSSPAHLTEAEALLQLSNQEPDEGIVSDQSSSADSEDALKRVKVRLIYQCLWKGCGSTTDSCSDIERHVRQRHLGRGEPMSEEDQDHEEEFYYNEVEVVSLTSPSSPSSSSAAAVIIPSGGCGGGHQMSIGRVRGTMASATILLRQGSSSFPPPTLAAHVADHMDMARPAHENPEFFRTSLSQQQQQPFAAPTRSLLISNQQRVAAAAMTVLRQQPFPMVPNFSAFSSANSTTNFAASGVNNGKYIRLSPKPLSPPASVTVQNGAAATAIKSPVRRPRGDAKKCRKVYGMDHRELWCTQCKWKKACTRFGEC